MYITSFDINYFGTVYQLTTQVTSGTGGSQVILTENIFYSNSGGLTTPPTYFGYLPMDVAFDSNFMYLSCAGNWNNPNFVNGTYTAGWTANITRFPVTYDSNKNATLGNPIILITQDTLSNYVSGIAVDSNYIYVVNAPNTIKYYNASASYYGNCNPNITQYDKTTGQVLNRFCAGFVGNLPDIPSLNTNNYTYNIASALRFDNYGNLFYVTYYNSTLYNQPYYLDSSGNILYNTNSTGTELANDCGFYYVQAFAPESDLETAVFSHKITTNSGQPVLALSIFNGNIYVAQYNKDLILEIETSISFGNFAYGKFNSQVTLLPNSVNNNYYITGGSAPVYNINLTASTLDYNFGGGITITTPSPIIANSSGTLYYYDNPSKLKPIPNTSYSLINSTGKSVGNPYVTLPGNETIIIYDSLSDPKCMTLDPQGFLYIANFGRAGDYQNGSIVKSTTTGEIIYIKQNIYIANPYAIKYNSKDGFIYYANTTPTVINGIDNFYIYKMTTDGNTFSLVYQDASYNFLYNPYELCFDSDGNIFITNGSTTTADGTTLNGSVTKISMNYKTNPAVPTKVQIFPRMNSIKRTS
jgi:hypothetical protein